MKPILYAYALEVIFLLLMSIVSIVMLGKLQLVRDVKVLSIMIKASVTISALIIPIESIILHSIIKHKGIRLFMLHSNEVIIVRLLFLCFVAFMVLWFVHSGVYEHVAETVLGYAHGSDEYMLWGRPGHLIIFPAGIASCIIHATMYKLL